MSDNLEEKQEALDPQENPQDVVEDPKEVRRQQQEEWSRQEALRLRNLAIETNYKLAQKDANSIVELYWQDPKLANEVAKKFGYDSYSELESSIFKKEEEDDFDKKYEKRRNQERHEEAVDKAMKTFSKLEADEKEKAETYFKKIIWNKTLKEDDALEFAEMATLYVKKDAKRKATWDDLIWIASTGISGKTPWNTKTTWDELIIVDGKLIPVSKLSSNK